MALAGALGKRPRLLMLDEPLADLDPLAREVVLRTLLTECRDQGITVLLSSHVLAELEGVCDHLVLLSEGRIQLAGDVTALLDGHVLLVGPLGVPCPAPPASVVDVQTVDGAQVVHAVAHPMPPQHGWRSLRPRLGQLTLAYMRSGGSAEVAA